jgi:hypothetical protein
VNRIRALILALLPVEVDPQSISEPMSRVITPQVIAAFTDSAGDFVEAVRLSILDVFMKTNTISNSFHIAS